MLRSALILVVVLIAAACSDDTPTSPTTGVEGVWRIISIQPPSQPAQTAPVGVQYQIGLERNRVLLRVDCNTCTGTYSDSGNTLTIGPNLACTRAACSTAAFENAVVSMLSGEHQTAATLHNLTLTSPRGSVLLQR
jgi:heat shock protein HslJ